MCRGDSTCHQRRSHFLRKLVDLCVVAAGMEAAIIESRVLRIQTPRSSPCPDPMMISFLLQFERLTCLRSSTFELRDLPGVFVQRSRTGPHLVERLARSGGYVVQ